jgi:site-specific DNA-cytosine methylase
MKYLSLFSGIGGFDIPLTEEGWECAGVVEEGNRTKYLVCIS